VPNLLDGLYGSLAGVFGLFLREKPSPHFDQAIVLPAKFIPPQIRTPADESRYWRSMALVLAI
jgi:hypothetical protein